MFKRLFPVLALTAALLTATPARADQSDDVVNASRSLIHDAYVLNGLLLRSVNTLETLAGDPTTQALVGTAAAAQAKIDAANPDPGAVKAVGTQLSALAARIKQAGFTPRKLTGPDLATLKQAWLDASAVGTVAVEGGKRALSVGQQAGSLIMSNPFGVMKLRPAAENASIAGGLATDQSALLEQAMSGLSKLAAANQLKAPTVAEIQAFASSLNVGKP